MNDVAIGAAGVSKQYRVVLPLRPGRAGLSAFRLTMGLWLALAAGALAPLALLPRAAVAVIAGGLFILVATFCPHQTEGFYRLWVRASRLYVRVARRWLLRLCYAVIAVAGVAGSSLILARPAPGRSMWQAVDTLPPQAYASQSETPGPGRPGRPWSDLVDWAIRSHNAWVVFMVPLLFLLSVLDTEEQRQPVAGIYTLF
jgi:hypothetical protein